MDISNIGKIENATKYGLSDTRKIGISLLFMLVTSFFVILFTNNYSFILIFSVLIGIYMAMNIGANDVANNMGPVVGSKAMSLPLAILVAAVFEASGAILAGGSVVDTIKSNIIIQNSFDDINIFITIMLSSLIAGAIWLNMATFFGAPVSTTHSIIGGLMGSSIVAGGLNAINWNVIWSIIISWIASPFMGGIIAATFLMIIKYTITYKQNKLNAAKKIIPALLFIMSFSFTLYLLQKGLKKVIVFDFYINILIAIFISIFVFLLSKKNITNKVKYIPNTNYSIGELFGVPLIFAGILLSFAHGANDVANAIGPLAAINQALNGVISSKSNIPMWIMVVGGLGIALGLILYGPKLIKTVGSEITDLDKIRAFCVAISASITVLIASALGIPVSSTHIAVGAIFGIGFLRENLKNDYKKMRQEIIQAHKDKEKKLLEKFLSKFADSSLKRKKTILKKIKKDKNYISVKLSKKDTKALSKGLKNELVKRTAIKKIIMAWIITVPISSIIGALAFSIIIKFSDKF